MHPDLLTLEEAANDALTSGGRQWPPAPSDVMTLEEVGALLCLSRPTMLKLAHNREIPCRRAGRSWRFSRAAVMAWLEGNDSVLHSPSRKKKR